MTQMGEGHLALQAFQLLCSLLGMAQIGLLLAQIVGGNARQVDERHALAHIERAVDMAAEIVEDSQIVSHRFLHLFITYLIHDATLVAAVEIGNLRKNDGWTGQYGEEPEAEDVVFKVLAFHKRQLVLHEHIAEDEFVPCRDLAGIPEKEFVQVADDFRVTQMIVVGGTKLIVVVADNQ